MRTATGDRHTPEPFSPSAHHGRASTLASRVGVARWSILQLVLTTAAKEQPIGCVLHCRRARRLERIGAGRRSHRRVRCARRPGPPMREL